MSLLLTLTFPVLKALRLPSVRSNLNKRTKLKQPTETVCDLIDIILKNNKFEFDGQFFLQKHGTAMGTEHTNLFLGALETRALDSAPFKPLYDILFIWMHGQDRLTDFIDNLNIIHPTVKFTRNTSSTLIHFLDVTVTLIQTIASPQTFTSNQPTPINIASIFLHIPNTPKTPYHAVSIYVYNASFHTTRP